MDLWIRSQDKKSLRIVSNINIIHEDDKFFICNYTGIANIKLGKYEYEKRALEVLDEIQNMLKPKLLVKINEFDEQEVHEKIRTNIFYEMPEE